MKVTSKVEPTDVQKGVPDDRKTATGEAMKPGPDHLQEYVTLLMDVTAASEQKVIITLLLALRKAESRLKLIQQQHGHRSVPAHIPFNLLAMELDAIVKEFLVLHPINQEAPADAVPPQNEG